MAGYGSRFWLLSNSHWVSLKVWSSHWHLNKKSELQFFKINLIKMYVFCGGKFFIFKTTIFSENPYLLSNDNNPSLLIYLRITFLRKCCYNSKILLHFASWMHHPCALFPEWCFKTRNSVNNATQFRSVNNQRTIVKDLGNANWTIFFEFNYILKSWSMNSDSRWKKKVDRTRKKLA